jgi:hypothetical protein
MFCGNCGSKVVEGNLFCVTCGRAQPPASPLKSIAGLVLEERRTPAEASIALKAVESASPMDVTARTGVSATQLGAKPLYCRHSRFQRAGLGVDREHGSEICLGCKLPYSPGSPNSRTEGVAQERNCNVAYGEKPVRRLPKLLAPIAAVALAFVLAVGVGWVYGVSHRQGQQSGPAASNSGPAASNSGPTASAMGCTTNWTLVKTTNGINIFDCSTAAGHQTLWRFDDAGAQASFMGTMSRAIRPKGHLVYSDKWAVISDSTESFRAAINAGGQDYGS